LAGLALVAIGTFSLSQITSTAPFWEVELTLLALSRRGQLAGALNAG
jgi:hypothetical protein